MNDRRCFEAFDRCLRDILDNRQTLFGGKNIILGGDFRQTLSVKKKASKLEIIDASITASYLWIGFKVYTLHQNMRLSRPEITEYEKERLQCFSSWLLDIGDGTDIAKITRKRTMAEPSGTDPKAADKEKLILFEEETINLKDIRPTHMKKTIETNRYTSIEPILNDYFPEHYFKFITCNEVYDKANATDAPLTGCIHRISDPIIIGDATRSRKTRRIIDIQNLDEFSLPFVIWDKTLINLTRIEYAKMPKPIVIAIVQQGRRHIYGGLQLMQLPATYYYFESNIPRSSSYIFSAVLEQTSSGTTPIPSETDTHQSTEDFAKGLDTSSKTTKKTAKRELFPDTEHGENKQRQQN
ncbi:DNA helicase [Tanacetum coccineum]